MAEPNTVFIVQYLIGEARAYDFKTFTTSSGVDNFVLAKKKYAKRYNAPIRFKIKKVPISWNWSRFSRL